MLKKRVVIEILEPQMRPTPAKTAEKAENHSKEGPINTTVCKSGVQNSHYKMKGS